MERETRMLLWTLFGIGVLTVAFLPAAWTNLNHETATGMQSNANMAQALWGQSTSVPTYVSGWSSDTSVPIIPGAVAPHVESVSWDMSTWGPKLVIVGYGFGNPPASGNLAITIADETRGWVAGNTSMYGVEPVIAVWRNDRIEVSGFSEYGETDVSNWSDGQGSWIFAPGDNLVITVTNPQTGISGTYKGQFPTGAPLPTVSISPIPTLVAGQTTNIMGHVAFAGQPISNQAVNVTVSSGSLGGTAYSSTPGEHLVYTDGSGNFSIPFTAPSGFAGNVSVQVMADGVTANETVAVILPAPTLSVTTPNPLPSAMSDGQNVTFQASANALPVGDRLTIIKANGGQTIASSTNTPLTASWTESSPGQQTYESEIVGSDGRVIATSSPITINWTEPLSITVTEFTPDGSDDGSSENEYYLGMSVNGVGLTTNVELTNLTHSGTTFPGDFYWVQRGSSNIVFDTETTTGAQPGDRMKVSVQTTSGDWVSGIVTLPGVSYACLYGCPEWSGH
ncbi:hypothetical protein [Alicyclobacillus hesperidum]|uniref:hypothetical protein n=1 Tax=Alicyclobacillus hesperidum TaxID=89784 RepID=UPI000305D37E|nr:hypothetical protein [Alicyclobacillus hesperidum]